MNVLKHAKLLRYALASLLVLCFTSSYAQWDWEYQVGVQMTQKPYSNSLLESSSGIHGVANDPSGIGFWIHTTDGFGKTAASYYYKTSAGTLRVYAIEAWNGTLFTAGEIDYGNGTTDMFIMSSDVTGGVNAAVYVPFGTNTIVTATDLVITASTSTTVNLMAVGYVDNSPTNKIPCSVRFDQTMGSFPTKEYNPGTGNFFVPTQAKLLDATYANNRVIVVGNDESNASKRIFRMKINTTNGNQAGSFRSHYISTTTDLYNPSVSATVGTNNVLIAASYSASSNTDVVLMRFPGNPGVNPTTVRQYDKNGDSDAPIQVHETVNDEAVIAYNHTNSSGVVVPSVAIIDMTNPNIVLSDIEYYSQHSVRRMFSAFGRGANSSTMYFECQTPNSDLTRTISSSTMTPCETTADLDYAATPSVTSPQTTGTTTSGTLYDDLIVDESQLTGSRYDCNGSFDGSFKKGTTSIDQIVEASTMVQQLSEGLFVLKSEEVAAYSVFDINGQLLVQNNHAAFGDQIDLTSLSKGVYIVSFTTTPGSMTQIKLAR